jgi:hypothetical protein
MTNEQLIAIILTNAATLFAVARWGVDRAIKYTHLERDVKELQDSRDVAETRHEKIISDLKGLSMKIDRRTGPKAEA